MKKHEILRKFASENRDIQTRTLAREFFKKYPNLYKNEESIRSVLRQIFGASGKQSSKDTSLHRPLFSGKPKLEPIEIKNEPFIFPDKKVLIMSDIHFPYHDLRAIEIAVDYGLKVGIDSIYLNGDIIDCVDISKFLKPFDVPTINEEREVLWEFLEVLKTLNLNLYFKSGNHEERIEHYKQRSATGFESLTELKIENILCLKHFDVTYIKPNQICKMGDLNVIHGHEFGSGYFAPVKPARSLFLKAKTNTLCGHYHQTDVHKENDLNGVNIACYTSGALCHLKPDYRPFAFTKWNAGFAVVEIENDSFHISNLAIINGRVV